MILTLRHTGLRICDVSTLALDRIHGDQMFVPSLAQRGISEVDAHDLRPHTHADQPVRQNDRAQVQLQTEIARRQSRGWLVQRLAAGGERIGLGGDFLAVSAEIINDILLLLAEPPGEGNGDESQGSKVRRPRKHTSPSSSP
jgi:hypothetical protein